MASNLCMMIEARFDATIMSDWETGFSSADLEFKWEKTDGSGVVTEINQDLMNSVISGGLGSNELFIFPPCIDATTGAAVTCNALNWEQTNTNLTQGSAGDYVGGYMGDGTYTLTLTRSDGCTTSISRNIILGCMDSSNSNGNSAATLDSDGMPLTYYIPPDIRCA